jgi:hypothetical protein
MSTGESELQWPLSPAEALREAIEYAEAGAMAIGHMADGAERTAAMQGMQRMLARWNAALETTRENAWPQAPSQSNSDLLEVLREAIHAGSASRLERGAFEAIQELRHLVHGAHAEVDEKNGDTPCQCEICKSCAVVERSAPQAAETSQAQTGEQRLQSAWVLTPEGTTAVGPHAKSTNAIGHRDATVLPIEIQTWNSLGPRVARVLTRMLVDQETMSEPFRNEAICKDARLVLDDVEKLDRQGQVSARGNPEGGAGVTDERREPWTDDQLRMLWRAAGGGFHGPRVETGAMAESRLLPFLRALAGAAPQNALAVSQVSAVEHGLRSAVEGALADTLGWPEVAGTALARADLRDLRLEVAEREFLGYNFEDTVAEDVGGWETPTPEVWTRGLFFWPFDEGSRPIKGYFVVEFGPECEQVLSARAHINGADVGHRGEATDDTAPTP